MSIHISREIEEQLRRLAQARGADVDSLAQEAVQQYLIAAATTDLTPEEIAEAQARLAPELHDWRDDPDAAR